VRSKLLAHRKYLKFQWLQNPSHVNADNLSNARHGTSRTFGGGGGDQMKDEITNFEIKCKNINIEDLNKSINEFKKASQPITYSAGDRMVTYSQISTVV
jgi:hypothetical protein